MKFDPILPEPRVQAMRKQRYWGDELLVDYLDRCIAQAPDKTAILDFNSMQGTEHGLSYREFGGLVDRIAVAAESANHHPDLLIHAYKRLRITLSTHSAGGLTESDIALAEAINAL